MLIVIILNLKGECTYHKRNMENHDSSWWVTFGLLCSVEVLYQNGVNPLEHCDYVLPDVAWRSSSFYPQTEFIPRTWVPNCILGLLMPERLIPVAACLLRLRVRIPLEAWVSVSCECCVCCQVEVSVTGLLLVLRSPIECGVSEAGITQGCSTHYSPASSVAS
jgi:hypothetical protein